MVNNYILGANISASDYAPHGISAKPNQTAVRLGDTSSDRTVLRRSMGYSFLSGSKPYTSFRLSEGVVPFCSNITSSDTYGLTYESPPCKGEVGNSKFVNDSSDYIKFKRLSAKNRNYNDASFVGDKSNGAQSVYRMRH